MLSREQSPGIMINSGSNSPTSSCSHNERNIRNGTALSKNGSRFTSQTNLIDASQPCMTSTNSNGATKSIPAVPNLPLSSLQTWSSAGSTTGGAAASQAHASEADVWSSIGNAATSVPAAADLGRPPSVPVARAASHVTRTLSVSMPRATASWGGARRTGGSAGSKAFMPQVITVAPDYTTFPPDVSKYLKDVIRRREEAAMLRLLPTAQLMSQAVLQAQAAYESIVQQEAFEFLQISHRRRETEMKLKEQESNKANREKIEEQKRQHKEEIVQQKNDVAAATRQTEAEIKEKLKTLLSLQPKLNIVPVVMAQLQDPTSDCALLGALMVEEKRLQKALKSDARYNKSKTAGMDGGAVPYWWKQCVCASFNVSAIVKKEPHRASIVDVCVATKTPADKKVVVVKDMEGNVVAWAHTRSGPDPNALAEAYLAMKLEVPELPANAYKGVLWPKEDAMDVMRKAKAAKSPIADILPEVITILSYSEMSSHEMLVRDVTAVAEAASQL
ncbi:hypothetical protein NXY56_002101 [Leishmania guyanensis]